MATVVDEVLQAISRNILAVSRQVTQDNPNTMQLSSMLRASIVNLERISVFLTEQQTADIRNALDSLIVVVNNRQQTTDEELPADESNDYTNAQVDNRDEVSARPKGRPSKKLDIEVITSQLAKGFTAKSVARHLRCSTSLVYKTLKKEGSSVRCKYSVVGDDQLDSIVKEIHDSHPNAGIEMVSGYLKAKGYLVQRRRVRESLTRVDPPAAASRWSSAISRREYSVPAPNSLWHMDGHMKLIRWGIVTHGCIDGYSRMITFLRCGTNNRAATVLNLFVEAVLKFGLSSRVRSDHGGENFQVALFINLVRGGESSNHITGRSVHNQRIERLWKDVQTQVGDTFYRKFYEMEDRMILDPSNDIHICALQLVYVPEINRLLENFQKGWNGHRIRTERNRSPDQIWMDGMLTAETSYRSVRELVHPHNIQGTLEERLQSFGLTAEDVSVAMEEDSVALRNGQSLSDVFIESLQREIQEIQCKEEQFLYCVQKIESAASIQD